MGSLGFLVLLACLVAASTVNASQTGGAGAQGKYFSKKEYSPQPLPRWPDLRLPSPIYDKKPAWIDMYWKAWEVASKNFYEPPPGSGFVSRFIDAAFNQNIFLWDSCFMTMFCNYAHPLTPGIGSLDNFYAKQYEDGEICREITRATGIDFAEWINRENRPLFSRWGWLDPEGKREPRPVIYQGRAEPSPNPRLTLDALNHPIPAWAELESYRLTGDRARLEMVWEPLVRYYQALEKYLRQGSGLYITDWASMDNSTRNRYLDQGGTGIDISSEMVLFARQMSEIAGILGKGEQAKRFAGEAEGLSKLINEKMWDPDRKFYFDLTLEDKRAPAKSIAAYWTLLARVASAAQAEALVAELKNPRTFGRPHRVPTLAADEPGYDPNGGYWKGAVWAPTNTMVIRGLEAYGQESLAREIALNHLEMLGQVFEKSGTVWENYAPEAPAPGKPAKGDFVGWTGHRPSHVPDRIRDRAAPGCRSKRGRLAS